MASHPERQYHSAAFAPALAGLLRESRRRQRLTQAEVSRRTEGAVSKAALANYEAANRSLRVEVFWLIARALGENPGALIAAVERAIGCGSKGEIASIAVRVAAVEASTDPRLAPVRRWFALRTQLLGPRVVPETVTLDEGALVALADLMHVTPEACRELLLPLAARWPAGEPPIVEA